MIKIITIEYKRFHRIVRQEGDVYREEDKVSTEKSQIEPGSSKFVPLLTTNDWNVEWVKLQEARHLSDDSSFWDKKAEHYNKPFGHSPYSRQFIEFSDIEAGDTIFDMGCGTGAIAIPLAMEGHEVCAADFSKGMLGHLEKDAAAAGVATIHPIVLSWEDDWRSHGIEPKSYDVAIASRSIATNDLECALMKLSSVARKKCAITVSAGSSPRSDQQILSEIGLQQYIGRDFLYAFMILVNAGYMPEVRYIRSVRIDTYEDEREAYESLKKMVMDTSFMYPKDLIEPALERLSIWVCENLVANPDAGKTNDRGEEEGKFMLKNPRKIIWAHLCWDV